MQLRKAHARWLVGGDPQVHKMWEISHPDAGVKIWSSKPHDAATNLIRDFVIPNQINAEGPRV